MATLIIFAAWMVLDFVVHGNILMGLYDATPALWRPMAEMKRIPMMMVALLQAFTFVFIYCQAVRPKSQAMGIKFGGLVGLLVGLGMGFGSYCYMPISMNLAIGWFLCGVVYYVVAGVITGATVKNEMHG